LIEEENILQVDISSEMKKSFIDYAMSVIVSRALPDVRDGLKPVHRRILYSMYELGITPDKSYRKCARIVGDVLGKYHPHGDTAVYESLVRMAQDFSMRYLLVDGHGNFGSVDGDGAAAMRYTEARMHRISNEMLRDIGKDTVDFIPNFDGEELEPIVLPSRFPNLLVNGSSGIAVGMATNIPPHNLGEIIDGLVMLIENKDVTIKELMTKILGPDFPTAGIILGKAGIREAYETGRGKIVVRAKSDIIEEKGRQTIIFTEIPYQVNKAKLVEYIGELVKDKKIEGISDLRDESSREGMRIVVEIKKDSNANVVLNQLYKHTRIQDTFGVIMLALVDREPKVLNLKEMLTHYLNFQEEIVIRRTKYDLNKALDRVHILEGFKIIFDHLDEVIRLIRASKNDKEALVNLINTFSLSEKQAQAVLDMRLRRLTNLEINRIIEEYEDLLKQINYFNSLLENESMILNIIKDELIEIRRKYADERRTKIESYYGEIEAQNLIEEKNVVITLTGSGYIKSISEDAYTSQKRGGKGIIATTTKEDDFVDSLLVTSTHNNLLFLSNKGKAYKLKAYEIQEAGRVAKGSNIINILPLENGEKIQDIISIKDLNEDGYLLMATKQGKIKKTELKNFTNIRKSGIIAITLADGDELLKVKRTMGDAEIVIVTALGYAIRFSEKDVRSMGRSAAGIKAITLRKFDVAVSMDIIVLDEELFVVSENGYGKRTPIEEYTITRRGAKGIKTYKISEKTGKIIGARMVSKNDEIMLMNSSNTAIRLNVSDISSIGRNAIGVKLMKLKENDPIVALTKISTKEESDE